MWGVLINLIREVTRKKFVPHRTGWFGAASRLFPTSLKFWRALCATLHKRGSEIRSRVDNGTENTPIAAHLSEAINEHAALITLSAAWLLQDGNFTTDWWCSKAPDWEATLGQGVDPALSSSPHKLGGRNTRDTPAPLKQGRRFTDDSASQPRDRTVLMLQEKKKVRRCCLDLEVCKHHLKHHSFMYAAAPRASIAAPAEGSCYK